MILDSRSSCPIKFPFRSGRSRPAACGPTKRTSGRPGRNGQGENGSAVGTPQSLAEQQTGSSSKSVNSMSGWRAPADKSSGRPDAQTAQPAAADVRWPPGARSSRTRHERRWRGRARDAFAASRPPAANADGEGDDARRLRSRPQPGSPRPGAVSSVRATALTRASRPIILHRAGRGPPRDL